MEALLLSCILTLPFSGQSLLLLSSLRLHERIVGLLPVMMTSIGMMLVLLGRDKGHRALILLIVLMLLPELLLVPLLDLSLLRVEIVGRVEWLELVLLPWPVVG